MSKTKRWWDKPHNRFRLKLDDVFSCSNQCTRKFDNRRDIVRTWKQLNPFYYRHEDKFIRVKIHRALRRINKVNLMNGFEIEYEQKTNGWLTY